MNQIISLAILVVGVALVVAGINATNSFNSDVSRFFTGSPTDKAVWTLLAGVGLILVGLTTWVRGSKSR